MGGLAPPIRPTLDSLLLLILAGSLEASIQFINVDLIQALFLRDWQGEVRGQHSLAYVRVEWSAKMGVGSQGRVPYFKSLFYRDPVTMVYNIS